MRKNKVSGFTLIELLVVITIIGILAVGGVSVYTTQMAKARDSTRLTDIKSLQAAVETYNSENSKYPGTGGTATGWTNNFVLSGSFSTLSNGLPKDPKGLVSACASGSTANGLACGYKYTHANSNMDYKLAVPMEDPNDNKRANDGGSATNSPNYYEIFTNASLSL